MKLIVMMKIQDCPQARALDNHAADIYIMMKCMCVTKNHHFLLGVSCNHPVQLQVSFDGSKFVFHSSMSVFIGFQVFRFVSRWFHGFSRILVGFHGFSS